MKMEECTDTAIFFFFFYLKLKKTATESQKPHQQFKTKQATMQNNKFKYPKCY